MKLSTVKQLLDADVLAGQDDLEREVVAACGADLMSDVLAYVKHDSALLTGLTNVHVVRTAEMLDVTCIIFVRGKVPTDDILEAANESGIVVMCTDDTLYGACGKLYVEGLPPTPRSDGHG